jgi:hypothetical protein
MAHLSPEFRHDVFVSYSSGDADGTGNAPLTIWSQAFARELERELRGLPGLQNAAVFLDASKRPEQGLASNDPLTQQLRDAATGAAFLLLLLSPHYIRSDWCRDERNWWLQQTAAQAFPEIGSRIFIARIWPTGDSQWPREICDERGNQPLGVWFHERPGNELTSRPLGWIDPTGNSGDFRTALVALTGQIAVRLKQLEETLLRRRRAAADIAKLAVDTGQLIYVHARVRDEARWEKAVDDLFEAGYKVVPSAPEPEYNDPREANVATNEVVRALSGCDGLLLVPGENALSLVSDLTVVGYQWRNSARAFAGKLLPCAVVDGGQMIGGKRRLQQSAQSLRIDWIDAATDDWTGQVRTWLGATAARQGGGP